MKILIWALVLLVAAVAGIALLNLDDIRLIETEVSVAVFAVAFERPGGLAPYPPADRISSRGLALYRGASLPGLAAAWLERGTSASTVIRHARRGPVSPDRGLGVC